MEQQSATPEDLPDLELRELRELNLDQPPADGMASHVASASGIARRGDFVYVIGDDLLDLAVFELVGTKPGVLRRALEGEMPTQPESRAKDKPALEALTALPPVPGEPNGGLLGVGSGSKPGRDGGFYWSLAPDGSLEGEPQQIDMHPVYETLRGELGDINIEGAAVFGDCLWLFHRGNRDDDANAVAEFGLGDLAETLGGDRVVDPEELRAVRTYELGELDGTPVCFSDATVLTDELVCFTASAERDDGGIAGSVVGTINAEGKVHRLRSIDSRWKVEGLDATLDTGIISFLFVCDQDDPETASPLLSATMPVKAQFDG